MIVCVVFVPWAQCASQSSKSKSVSFCRDERTANEYAFNYQIKLYLCAEYVLESSRQFCQCVSTLTHTHTRVLSWMRMQYAHFIARSCVYEWKSIKCIYTRTAAAACRKKHTIWLEEMDKRAFAHCLGSLIHMAATTIERQMSSTTTTKTMEQKKWKLPWSEASKRKDTFAVVVQFFF